MLSKFKIALQIPEKADRFFSFRLHERMSDEPAEYKQSKKIFVISDIVGNFQSFCKLLIKGGVIDKYLHWTFEDNHLVIVGNCFDVGEQVTECLWLIYSLEEKAHKEGGYVHFILGNHEIMNMNGGWRYAHPNYAEKKGTSSNPTAALYDGNNEIWRWLCTKNIIEKIGNTLFVHGGISVELLRLNLSITEINNLARPWYAAAGQTFTDPQLCTIFNSESSPFCYRGYYHQPFSEALIDATLVHFNVNNIVTGHTMVDHVHSYYNGKVINIHTNHAAVISEALLIKGHRFYKMDSAGKKERLK